MRNTMSWMATFAGIAVLALGIAQAETRSQQSGGKQPPAPGGKASEGPSDAIRAVLTTQQAAWNGGDIPAFLQGYWNSPELTFSGSDGIVRGYDGLLDRYRRSYPDRQTMGELEFSGLEIRVLAPEAALVLGHWHLKRSHGDLGGVFTLVFRRFPVGWRIIHDHTSAQEKRP
jgi:ketosteroid isomerase-like protein